MTTSIDGTLRKTLISFPGSGPESIYDLGVARNVSIRDEMPAPEPARLVAQRQNTRMDFDRYYGMAIQVRPDKHWSNSVRVTRLWRSGSKWRTEHMIWAPSDMK